MTGNPVKIGGGCATVTGYKLPYPLVRTKAGREGGARHEARSQDTGGIVLVSLAQAGHFSAKEKDETSPSKRFRWDLRNGFIPRFAGVGRVFHAPRWSLNQNRSVHGQNQERPVGT